MWIILFIIIVMVAVAMLIAGAGWIDTTQIFGTLIALSEINSMKNPTLTQDSILEQLRARYPKIEQNKTFDWLNWKGVPLSFDYYDPVSETAFDFIDQSHYNWDKKQEEYSKYFDRIVTDLVKKRLAKLHKIPRIVIDLDKSSITGSGGDCCGEVIGGLDAAPMPKPKRSPAMEKILNCGYEIECAKKIYCPRSAHK
jgi:hypothetical protein